MVLFSRRLFFVLVAVANCEAFLGPKLRLSATRSSTRISFTDDDVKSHIDVEQLRREWTDKSVNYYSKVMREKRRRDLGQAKNYQTRQYQEAFQELANKHYFALRKIKDGKPEHAETIYRKIIRDLLQEEKEAMASSKEDCDHSKLAITTLLLALNLQRMGADAKRTRSAFLKFFRVIALTDKGQECACSAKVIGAFALFEMKQGNTTRSLQLARLAMELDPTKMSALLNWKQFRDAAETTGSDGAVAVGKP